VSVTGEDIGFRTGQTLRKRKRSLGALAISIAEMRNSAKYIGLCGRSYLVAFGCGAREAMPHLGNDLCISIVKRGSQPTFEILGNKSAAGGYRKKAYSEGTNDW
jgi:hypothetical protein